MKNQQTHRYSYSLQQGFTLVELMMALLVASIMLGIGVPSMQSTLAKNATTTSVKTLRVMLQEARSQALDKNRWVSICPSSNATEATASCSTSDLDWNDGIIMFFDGNGDGVYDNSDDEVIRIHQGLNTAVTATQNTNTAVVFNSQGYLDIDGTNFPVITFCHSSNEDRYARALYVTASGSTILSRDTNSDGIHNLETTSSTENIECQ